ncbi:hypothetical protein JCM19298_2815 [Nonlabens ulvanivorans]|nr:hypothetical protein [Nonlabens ulvanivorans]GAK92327.1 hypothetical protein JCM19298_2815 [Nonlabens ulvanivorans]
MSAKMKMYLVYGVVFLALFLGLWVLSGYIFEPDSTMRKLTPIVASIILSPKPHVVETQSGRQYGLKSLFSKKIYWFKD